MQVSKASLKLAVLAGGFSLTVLSVGWKEKPTRAENGEGVGCFFFPLGGERVYRGEIKFVWAVEGT